MTSDTRAVEESISALSDDALLGVLSHELATRHSLRSVRDQVSALLAMGPGLERSLAQRLADVTASATRARIVGEATAPLLEDHLMLDSASVSRVLGKAATSRNTASRLLAAGAVVALPVGQRRLYPEFQFDAASSRVRPIVAEVNKLLDAKNDPWGVASWWLNRTDFSDDPRSPAELAVDGRRDDDLRDMAHDLLAD